MFVKCDNTLFLIIFNVYIVTYGEMHLTLHLFVLFMFWPNVSLVGETLQGHHDDARGEA